MRLATFLCESEDKPVDDPAPDPDASAPDPTEEAVLADGNSFSLPVRLALGAAAVLGF